MMNKPRNYTTSKKDPLSIGRDELFGTKNKSHFSNLTIQVVPRMRFLIPAKYSPPETKAPIDVKSQVEKEELTKMIQMLMENSSKIEAEKNKFERENMELKEKLNANTNESSAVNEEYAKRVLEISNEFTEATAQLEKLQKEKSERDQEFIELQNKFQNIQQIFVEKETEIEKLRNQVKESQDEFEKFKLQPKDTKLQEAYELINKVEIDKDKIERQLAEKTSQYEATIGAFKFIEKELEKVKNEKNALSKEMKLKEDMYKGKIDELLENIEKKNSDYNNLENRFNQSQPLVKKLQSENEKLKDDIEHIKTESFNNIEELKSKFESASSSLLAPAQIQEIYSEHLYLLYEKEISFSIQDIINFTTVNFTTLIEGCFNSVTPEKMPISLTILQEYMKDIFFLLYIRAVNLKRKENYDNKADIIIDNADFNDEFIMDVVKELYVKNHISKMMNSSKELIDDYIKKIGAMNLNEETMNNIKGNFVSRLEKKKLLIQNSLKTLVEKCASTIKKGTINFDNKKLFDFTKFICKSFNIQNGNLYVDLTQLTNETIESLIYIMKYPSENILKIQLVGRFNYDKITECNIMKLFLAILSFIPKLLSFSLTSCNNFPYNLIQYLIFIIDNLRQLKILNLDGDKLGDHNIKLITQKLKLNRSIIALFLAKNDITEKGGVYISDLVNQNKTIERLYLSGNNITENGISSLLTSIVGNGKISLLDLSSNDLSPEDFEAIEKFFYSKPKLLNLNISNNVLDMQGAIAVGASIANAQNLKCINIANMNIVAEYTPLIFKNFLCEEIILDDNPLDEVGLMMISKALTMNRTIKKLSMKNTQISALGLIHMLTSLQSNTVLKEIHLENNTLDENGCELINKFVKLNFIKFFVSKDKVVIDKFKYQPSEKIVIV